LLKDEVVMLGAHLDSWQAGTGATDNASGSAVMLEAMRILKALGVQPRRTIRIGLWSAEEQGLMGSRGYVAKTFGVLGVEKSCLHTINFLLIIILITGQGKLEVFICRVTKLADPSFSNGLNHLKI
jgi:acetylornithine deacetylase/succinyl-diaminopimelate desuccinylase-like protein